MGLRKGRVGVCFPAVALLAACAATDPGVEGLTRGEFLESGTPPQQQGGSDSRPVSDGAASDSSSTDAGLDVGAQASVFGGDGTYASNLPGTTAATFHMNNAVGVTPGLGVDCLTCHKNGGSGKEFLFGGTVFQDMAGTMPAADTEVRVLGSDNVGYSAHSDTDGNVWFVKGATGIAFPAQSGVRDGTNTVLMVNSLSAANCNGCHDNTTQAALHIP